MITIGAVLVSILVIWYVWIMVFSPAPSATQNQNTGTGVTLPGAPSIIPVTVPTTPPSVATSSQMPVRVLQVTSPQDPAIASNFKSQIQNANLITLGGTIVVSSYALQIWGDVNKGGEALLEYASSTGWTLMSLGGGEWTVDGLVQEGVPQNIAEQLVAGLGN